MTSTFDSKELIEAYYALVKRAIDYRSKGEANMGDFVDTLAEKVMMLKSAAPTTHVSAFNASELIEMYYGLVKLSIERKLKMEFERGNFDDKLAEKVIQIRETLQS